MREWRKVYGKLRSSEKLSRVNFESKWLYILLLLAQDDAGQYPWTPTMIRELGASVRWTPLKAERLLSQLVESGLVTKINDMIIILNGKELNGNPRPTKYSPRLYPGQPRVVPGSSQGRPQDSPGSHRGRTEDVPGSATEEEERREEQRREEEKERTKEREEEKRPEDKREEEDAAATHIRAQSQKITDIFSEDELLAIENRFHFSRDDILWEAQKCFEWWSTEKKVMKNHKLALKNWFEKASKNGHSKSSAPANSQNTDWAAEKAAFDAD